jgi:transcriptional regulator with XRE-family HTH domain
MIGLGIKNIREWKGISQQELAEKIYSSQTNISRIENGSQKPSKITIEKIALALSVPVMVLTFAGLEEKDVFINKRESFRVLKPAIDNLIKSLWVD